MEKNLNSKLVNNLFNDKIFYEENDSFGNFVLDTYVMKNIFIPRKIEHKIAIKELRIIKDVFDKFKVTFFLTHGSCLGAVREKNFITYDSDIDIGCYKQDIDKVILSIKELRDNYNFKITKLSIDDESIAIIRDNVIIDISLYRNDGGIWKSNKNDIFNIPNEFLKNLEELVFLGLSINVPFNVIKYLVNQYGEDWIIPIENFHSPYKQKIEFPIINLLKNVIGKDKAATIAGKISNFVKNIRNK